MSAPRAHGSAASARAAVLGCLLAVLAAGSGVCQTGGAKITIVLTGPLMYTSNQQGSLVRDESALPGAQIGLQPVDPNAVPDATAVAYDVTLLDLAKPKGSLDAVQEGPPIILTPARLAELRRRHAPALAGGFDEQAWSDLVADLLGQPASATPKDAQPATSEPGGSGARAGKTSGASPAGGKPGGAAPGVGRPGSGQTGMLELPQRRLLWELLKLASAPQLFVDFDGVNRPRAWGALGGRPDVAATGAQLQETGPQRDLLAASAGIQGLVLIRNEDGSLVPPQSAVGVDIIGTPGGHQKTWTATTNSVGYFCWLLPEDAGGPGKYRVGVPGTDRAQDVTAAQGSWSNVVIISAGPLPAGAPGEKGFMPGSAGAPDAVGFVGALTGLLAGTAAGSIVPALSSSGLPLQTGVVWTPHNSARAYYGVERALASSSYDRSLSPLGPANLVIEFWKYPLVSPPGALRRGEVEGNYRERAKALSDAAETRYEGAKGEADATSAELDRLAKIIQAAHPETDAVAYKALIESQIALRKECRERRSETEALEAAYRVQLDLYELCRARELQAIGPTGAGAHEIWTALCATYNRYGQLPDKLGTDDVSVLCARIEQKLADDSARAAKLGPDAQFQDPRLEHLAYEGTPQRQEKLGYVRFLRVRLIATGISADEFNIATRLSPGRWGMSAGMVAGGKGSQPAVGGWWLWERLGLRLTAGSTIGNGKQPAGLMLGCGVQVPIGTGGSGGSATGAAAKAPGAPPSAAPAAVKGSGAAAGASAPPSGGPPAAAPVSGNASTPPASGAAGASGP